MSGQKIGDLRLSTQPSGINTPEPNQQNFNMTVLLTPGEPGYEAWAAENKGPLILGVTSALTLFAMVFVVGRTYSRLLSVGKLAVDDYIVIVCLVRASPSHLGTLALGTIYLGT